MKKYELKPEYINNSPKEPSMPKPIIVIEKFWGDKIIDPNNEKQF